MSQSAASAPPTVVLASLGGTILGERTAEGGYSPTLSADEFVGRLGRSSDLRLEIVDPLSVPSAELRLDDVIEVCRAVRERVARGAVGAVVLCGTDTLEEVAFGFDLLWDRAEPLVVTGALRPPDAAGADGPANVMAALSVATATTATGRGCLVVMNDEIHAARHVRKLRPSSPAAFGSSPGGPVGLVVEGRPWFLAATYRPPALPLHGIGAPESVALVTFSIGDEAWLVDAVETSGYRGLVVEGSGGGSVSARWADALGRLAERIPVVYASRTGSGPVLRETYGGPGGEIDLVHRGVVPSGVLDGLKSRVLLSLLLAGTPGGDRDRILAAFGQRAGMEREDRS